MDDAEFEAAMADLVAPEDGTPTEEPAPEVAEVVAEAVEPEQELPEAEAETVEEVEEAAEVLLAGKYRTPEELEQAYLAAQSKIGEQGSEMGELRRMVQELYERPEPQRPQTSPFISEEAQEAIDTNPAQVATWAIQNEQPHLYEAALSEWYDQSPKEAARFERALEREMLKAEIRQEVNPALESTAKAQESQAANAAILSLSQKYEDFQQVLGSATNSEVAGVDRNLLASLQKENPTAAFEYMYLVASRARGQNQAAQVAQRTNEVREEKRAAAVVTADQSVETAEPTVQEKLTAFMLEPDPWNVQHGLTRE